MTCETFAYTRRFPDRVIRWFLPGSFAERLFGHWNGRRPFRSTHRLCLQRRSGSTRRLVLLVPCRSFVDLIRSKRAAFLFELWLGFDPIIPSNSPAVLQSMNTRNRKHSIEGLRMMSLSSEAKIGCDVDCHWNCVSCQATVNFPLGSFRHSQAAQSA